MKKFFVAFFALCLLAYILPLGIRPLSIPDEARYGEIAREMLSSGDWVVPRLNGLKYFEKPVLGYWANAVSIKMFGENAFAIRLTSVFSVMFSACLIFLLVRKASPSGTTRFLAPAVFLTSPLVIAIGQISILDSLLSMLLTGVMVCFFFAHRAETGAGKTLFLILTGGVCGLAFLTKGFLAFAVPVLAIVPFLLWEGRVRDLFRIPWIPLITALLVALPWSLMIHFREGDFWRYFFWTEHVARFVSPVAGQHPEPLWYFLPILAAGILPWTVQIPPALSMVVKLEMKNPLVRFAICWFLFPFLFFSICSGKLIPYILPCIPPVAVIVAVGLTHYFEAGKMRAFSIAAWVLAGIIGITGAVLLTSGIFLNEEMRFYGADEGAKQVAASLAAFVWAFLTVWSIRVKDYRKRLLLYCTGIAIFLLVAGVGVPSRVMNIRAPGGLLERNLPRVTPDAIVVSNDNVLRAVCWFLKRDNVKMLEEVGELAYGVKHDDADPGRFLTLPAFQKILRENAGKRPVILVLNASYYRSYRDQLPLPAFVDTDNHFVFAMY